MPKTGKDFLIDSQVKACKPEDKTYFKRDGGGLWLVVEPTGKKWWKLRTVFVKKENSFSLGEYPAVTLSDAREQRDTIRKQISAGIDPAAPRKEEKARASGDGSFEVVARSWHDIVKKGQSPAYAEDNLQRLARYVFPYIGKRPMEEITYSEMEVVLRRIEARSVESAHRAKITCSQVFKYEMKRNHKILKNPVADQELQPSKPKHMAAPTDPKKVAPLLRMLDGYEGSFIVACALRLAPLVFVRPGELRTAEWAAIDLDQAEWRYEATKTGTDHIVPLSMQALEILREIHPLTGAGRYVFPAARSAARPMGNTTINAAMRRMGIDTQEELTGHGFRAMARTILDEVLGYRPDLIEHQLAHAVKDPLGRAYNRTSHLPARREMMQAWADYLDGLKAGGQVIPIRAAAG
jgi:integrase